MPRSPVQRLIALCMALALLAGSGRSAMGLHGCPHHAAGHGPTLHGSMAHGGGVQGGGAQGAGEAGSGSQEDPGGHGGEGHSHHHSHHPHGEGSPGGLPSGAGGDPHPLGGPSPESVDAHGGHHGQGSHGDDPCTCFGSCPTPGAPSIPGGGSMVAAGPVAAPPAPLGDDARVVFPRFVRWELPPATAPPLPLQATPLS
jgi:hypothetical protein